MHNGFHAKSNVDQLYLSRSEGSRGLIGAQDNVETAILGLRNYVRNSKERFFIAACTIEDDENRETPNECKKMKKNKKETTMDTKKLHGQFFRQTTVKQVKIGWDG